MNTDNRTSRLVPVSPHVCFLVLIMPCLTDKLQCGHSRPSGLSLRDPNHMWILCERGGNRGFLDEYGQ
jgi:hypothetical protein